jgi:cell division protein FtsX
MDGPDDTAPPELRPEAGSARPEPTLAGWLAALLRRTGRVTIERPRSALWTLLALTAALFAVAVAAVAADNVDTWTRAPRGRASVVVYLAETMDAAHGAALAADLGKQSWVDHADYVPPAESARRLQVALGPVGEPKAGEPQLLDGVDVASLPASIELTLAPGVRDVVAMSPTMRSLRDAPGIDDVVVEDGGEDRVATTAAAVREVAWGGAALFAGLALLIALAAVRVRFDGGRRELAVARLLGAGPSYTAIPSALAGMLHGAIAAGAAVALLYAEVAAYGSAITDALASAVGAVDIAMPCAGDVLLFVAGGAALGLIGGSLAGVTRAAR